MKTLTYFILLLLSLSSCASDRPIHVSLANKHAAHYSRHIAKSEGLWVYGYGGQMCGNIQAITIFYGCHRMVTIEEARQLYIPVVEGMIAQVNDDPEIRPFLDNYPATNKNIDMSISFRKKKGGHIEGDGLVAFVFCVRGTVCYSRYNPETDLLERMHEEPYEVAKAIVMGDNSCSEAVLGDAKTTLECPPGA